MPAVRFGAAQKLFSLNGKLTSAGYEFARHGRFVFARPASSAADAARAVYIQNWEAALQPAR